MVDQSVHGSTEFSPSVFIQIYYYDAGRPDVDVDVDVVPTYGVGWFRWCNNSSDAYVSERFGEKVVELEL